MRRPGRMNPERLPYSPTGPGRAPGESHDLTFIRTITAEESSDLVAAEGLRPPELNDYRVQREFKAWLSEFRSLDDRTSAWLSGKFGQQSDIYEGFKALLSTEFDNNFAYRLCCALRGGAGEGRNARCLHSRRTPGGNGTPTPRGRGDAGSDGRRTGRDLRRVHASPDTDALRPEGQGSGGQRRARPC